MPTSSPKTVIVTGGNSGLGEACVRALVAAGNWHVVIAARDSERSAAAATAIKRQVSTASVSIWKLDLGALKQLPAAIAELRARNLPPLHGLICNAGVQLGRLGPKTVEGVEQTFGVNHLGHFVLWRLLRSHFTTPTRVVVVSSGAHDATQRTGMPPPRLASVTAMAYPQTDPALDNDPGLAARRAYATSKLCNVLFASELDRRERRSGVAACSFDPGFMPGTDLSRSMPVMARMLFRALTPFSRFIPSGSTPRVSGSVLANLVTERNDADVQGRYINIAGVAQPSPEARDLSKAAALWDESIELARSLGIDFGRS